MQGWCRCARELETKTKRKRQSHVTRVGHDAIRLNMVNVGVVWCSPHFPQNGSAKKRRQEGTHSNFSSSATLTEAAGVATTSREESGDTVEDLAVDASIMRVAFGV